MSDLVHLVGADDVRSAGHTMRSAAETMSQAALNIDGALERHQRFLEDWLQRFEAAVEKMPKTEMQLKREQAERLAEQYRR
jgi:hypothetical protein